MNVMLLNVPGELQTPDLSARFLRCCEERQLGDVELSFGFVGIHVPPVVAIATRDLETLIKNSGSLKVICSGKIYAVYQDHVPEPFLEPHVVRFGHYMAAESAEDLLPAEALALRIMSGHLRQFVRTYDLMCTGAMSAANSGYPYVQH